MSGPPCSRESAMLRMILSGLFVAPLLAPLPALAADAVDGSLPAASAPERATTGLSIEKKPPRIVAHPLPSRETIAHDTEEAMGAPAQRQRRQQQAAAEEMVQRPWHRPDLDYDVHSPIQQRALHRH